MQFVPLPLSGAYLVELTRHRDERGFFARTWCAREFAAHGLNPRLSQTSVSYNEKRGTLRGMHYQVAPAEEAKLVTCIAGSIFDVIVDVREGSPTYRQWTSVTLQSSPDVLRGLYVPEGFAHGFQTLEDETVILYQISEFFAPETARGIRHDDPALGIPWPVHPAIVAPKDFAYPLLAP
ncbi:dTDP-4-dehydrorhamnose 3,5-epimerase [Pendulispora brunnea]|uniref:dTDP-4-dehydrorhamnose 3,5-epimerase n=1 Tax=Pendulispora brunnea TaxID=2905690 RepID=A0ABZ2K4R1_9BACT